jgi:hypothetical protein
MAMYESEHTVFMREWMKQHPEALREQAQGRSLWWDKNRTQELETGYRKATVPVKPYYYDPHH